MFTVALLLLWCGYLEAQGEVMPSDMLTISSVFLEIRMCFFVLLGSPLVMSGWLGRSLLLVSAS